MIRPFRRFFRERRNAIILHRGLNTEEGRVAVLNRILACFPRQTVPFSEFSSCAQEKYENAKRALRDPIVQYHNVYLRHGEVCRGPATRNACTPSLVSRCGANERVPLSPMHELRGLDHGHRFRATGNKSAFELLGMPSSVMHEERKIEQTTKISIGFVQTRNRLRTKPTRTPTRGGARSKSHRGSWPTRAVSLI